MLSISGNTFQRQIGVRVSALIGLCLLLFLASCHKDDPKKTGPENFYTIQVASDYDTSQTDDWVMASDKNGVWLDSKPFESGQTIVLNAIIPAEQTFTIHFFSKFQAGANTRYGILSYSSVPVKGTWMLNPPTPPPNPTALGTSMVTVSNITMDQTNLSYLAVSSLRGFASYSSSTLGTTTDFLVSVYDASTDFVISFFKNNLPYVVKADGVTPGGTVSIDAATQAIPMDVQFLFDYTGESTFNAYFMGYQPGQDVTYPGYTFSQFFSQFDDGTITLGYLNGYEHYKTEILQEKDGIAWDYYKFGTPITQPPTFPKIIISIDKGNPSDISASTNIPFNISTLRLSHTTDPNFVWTILQPKSAASANIELALKPFPTSMTELFPVLDITMMKVSHVEGVQIVDSFSYSDLLDQKQNSESGYSKEYYRFWKNF